AWAPRVRGRPAAVAAPGEPAGPPLPLRWAGSTLRCMSCHDSTVSSIAIVYRPASSSLRFDHTGGDVRRREGARRNYFALPDEWGGRVMGNHPVSVPYPLDLEPSGYRRYEPRAAPLPGSQGRCGPPRMGRTRVDA